MLQALLLLQRAAGQQHKMSLVWPLWIRVLSERLRPSAHLYARRKMASFTAKTGTPARTAQFSRKSAVPVANRPVQLRVAQVQSSASPARQAQSSSRSFTVRWAGTQPQKCKLTVATSCG